LFGRAAQQFFDLQNRAGFAPHFVNKKAYPPAPALSETAARSQSLPPAGWPAGQIFCWSRVSNRGAGSDIQHADALSLQHQRHGQFRRTLSIALIYRASLEVSLTRTEWPVPPRPVIPCPWESANCRQLARVADGKSVRSNFRHLRHQHAKNFIVNVPFDQSRRSRQDLARFQRAVHFLADFRQRGRTSAEISAPPLNAVAVVCFIV